MITVVVIYNGQEQVHTFNGCRCDAQRFIREVVKNEMYDEIKITGKIDNISPNIIQRSPVIDIKDVI